MVILKHILKKLKNIYSLQLGFDFCPIGKCNKNILLLSQGL